MLVNQLVIDGLIIVDLQPEEDPELLCINPDLTNIRFNKT